MRPVTYDDLLKRQEQGMFKLADTFGGSDAHSRNATKHHTSKPDAKQHDEPRPRG